MNLVEDYQDQREIRGDILILAPKERQFIHVGPSEWSAGYDPKQGFYVYPGADTVLDKKNLILDAASIFLAQRMQPGATTIAAGINALAIGTGVGTGTTQNPQAPTADLTALRSEVYRKLIDSWTFLDVNGNATGTATNVIQITTNVDGALAVPSGQSTVALTEAMLLGGSTSSAAANTNPYNMVTYPVWNLQNTSSVAYVWTLTF